jgi:hypothetical protein
MGTRSIHDAVPVSECFTNRKLALTGEAVLLRDLSLSQPKVRNRYGAKQRFPLPSAPGADGRGAAPSSSQAMRTLRRRGCLRSIIRTRNRNHSERYADTMTSYDCPVRESTAGFPRKGTPATRPDAEDKRTFRVRRAARRDTIQIRLYSPLRKSQACRARRIAASAVISAGAINRFDGRCPGNRLASTSS